MPCIAIAIAPGKRTFTLRQCLALQWQNLDVHWQAHVHFEAKPCIAIAPNTHKHCAMRSQGRIEEHVRLHSHTHTHTHVHTHAHTGAHTHTHAHTHIYTHMHTHTHTQTRTHTNTNKRRYVSWLLVLGWPRRLERTHTHTHTHTSM